MGRLAQKGLDYFPLDTTWETSVKLVKARYGALEGAGFLTELWASIYRENYYREWNEEAELLFADEIKRPVAWVHEVVEYCFDKGIFDRAVYEAKGVLTSHGIQRRYFKTVLSLGRTYIDYIKGITHPDYMQNPIPPGKADIPPGNRDNLPGKADKLPGNRHHSSTLQGNEVKNSSAARDELSTSGEAESLAAFCLARAQADPKVKNKTAYAATLATKADVLADWRKSLEPPPPPEPEYPPPPDCEDCGGDLMRHPGQAENERRCSRCKVDYVFDDDWGLWKRKEAALVDEFLNTG